MGKSKQTLAAFYNLSQLMRLLFGFGTPKQLATALERSREGLFYRLAALLIFMAAIVHWLKAAGMRPANFFEIAENPIRSKMRFLQQAARERRGIGRGRVGKALASLAARVGKQLRSVDTGTDPITQIEVY